MFCYSSQTSRGWSRALIWASIVMLSHGSSRGTITVGESIDRNIKILEYYDSFSFCLLRQCVLIQYSPTKESYRWQLFIFMRNVIFSFSTFLKFGRSDEVSPKSVYRLPISSWSALDFLNNFRSSRLSYSKYVECHVHLSFLVLRALKLTVFLKFVFCFTNKVMLTIFCFFMDD